MSRTICASLLVSLLSAVLSAQSAKPEPLIINGQVLDDHGHPVAGASVTASPVGGLKGRLPMTTADGRGEFSVVVHQTGAFVVTASKTEEALLSTANPFYQASLDPTAQVTVVTSQLPPFATVHLGPQAGKLIMRVSDADANTPVTDVQISLCRSQAPRYCHRSSGKSSKGLYPELVPAAPFTIKVSAAGYEDSDSVGARLCNWRQRRPKS